MRPTSRALSARLPVSTVCQRPLFFRAAATRTTTPTTRNASRLFSFQAARASPAQDSEPKPKIPYSAFSFAHLGISNKWNKYIMIFFITMGILETYLWYKYLLAWWKARSNTAIDGPQSHTGN
ncbi:hypothetical protein B0H65DRAFT_456893 [Neurospora tetraspora]|uniref:Uncharacterized protein n=1 Tax=Neurospora tetraspora TaxID=94610 RepID=A0AAE0MU44_9PEZI|nr:hypothetical protein B0H65DRAFT_456893 [Neurospora tetraspora]